MLRKSTQSTGEKRNEINGPTVDGFLCLFCHTSKRCEFRMFGVDYDAMTRLCVEHHLKRVILAFCYADVLRNSHDPH